jgi:hypothetical protein
MLNENQHLIQEREEIFEKIDELVNSDDYDEDNDYEVTELEQRLIEIDYELNHPNDADDDDDIKVEEFENVI